MSFEVRSCRTGDLETPAFARFEDARDLAQALRADGEGPMCVIDLNLPADDADGRIVWRDDEVRPSALHRIRWAAVALGALS